jgi:hypothetical protein
LDGKLKFFKMGITSNKEKIIMSVPIIKLKKVTEKDREPIP